MVRKKAGIPGSIYRNKNRYWWKVALPGEGLPKSRPLKPRGARFATGDYNVAVEVAREMWQQALFRARRIDDSDDSVAGLVQAYLRHCRDYYRQSNDAERIRQGLTCLIGLYSHLAAEDFGPRHLKAVRQVLIDKGLARNTINKYIGMIRRMFDWAVEEERIPASVAYGLRCVSSLRRGRSLADILHIAGENGEVTNHRLATLRAMLGGFGNPPVLSPSATSNVLRRHHDAIAFALAQLPTVVSARGVNTATTRAVVARAYYSVDHTLLKDFCRQLTTGIVTSVDEGVIVLLRQHLQANRGGSYSQRVQRYGKVERVLSAWLKGENPSRLYPASGEQFPLPEEVAA